MPLTLIEIFKANLNRFGSKPALTTKINNKWHTRTFQEYFDEAKYFAQATISLGIKQQTAINILGFNAPEWHISYYGSIMGFYIPVGIYTTNGPEACQYVSEHSNCELVVLENMQQLSKYLKIWDSLPKLKAIVVYRDTNLSIESIPQHRRS